MSHEINLPFGPFERHNLALCIVKKQQTLIQALKEGKSDKGILILEIGITLMLAKFLLEADETEKMILS